MDSQGVWARRIKGEAEIKIIRIIGDVDVFKLNGVGVPLCRSVGYRDTSPVAKRSVDGDVLKVPGTVTWAQAAKAKASTPTSKK